MVRKVINLAFMKANDLLLQDQARLMEWFSALNLFAWAHFLFSNPDILTRDSYRGFGGESALFWSVCFAIIGLFQFLGLVANWRHSTELRFLGCALAAGAWTVVAWNFWSTGISTTANFNYSLLAGACAISGAWLAWSATSYQS